MVRLVDVQVVSASANVTQSEKLSLGYSKDIDGARGRIVDSSGTVLAESQLVYDLQMDPAVMKGLEDDENNRPKLPWAKASNEIAAITGLTGDEVRKIASDALADDPGSHYAMIKTGLSTDHLKIRALGLAYSGRCRGRSGCTPTVPSPATSSASSRATVTRKGSRRCRTPA